MALLTCHFDSEAPQRRRDLLATGRVIPQEVEPPPVLYLLHGLTDDHTGWHRYTSVERYADEAGLAVVMPAVHHSFYTDEVHGHAYWTYVSEELPASGPVGSSASPTVRRTPSSPGSRWAGTAPSSSPSPTPTGTPPPPPCPARSTSAT